MASFPAPADKGSLSLQHVLDASLNCVVVYKSVYNERRQLVDFRVDLVNQTAAQTIGLRSEELLGQLISYLFPGLVTTGVVSRFKEVLASGRPVRFNVQQYLRYRRQAAWFDVSVVPIDDSLVVSFVDITDALADAERANRQAALLNDTWQAAQQGQTIAEAVRDEAGRIVEFRFKPAP